MLIQRNFNNKTYAVEVGEPRYKQSFRTSAGIIELALVKPYSNCSRYDIVEVSTGTYFVTDVGRLSKTSFKHLCMAFCFFGAKKIKSRVNESKKIEDFPLWKEED